MLHAPKERSIDSFSQLGTLVAQPLFITYITFVSFTSFILITIYAPRYGNKYILIYILICSLVGSLSVMSVKGLGLGIRESISSLTTSTNQFKNPFFWLVVLIVITTVSIQMIYLNKSLDIFDTSIVTPIYYVFFTSFVLMASSILFKELNQLNFTDILGTFVGFIIVIVAIFLLNAFKDSNITLGLLMNQWFNGNGNHNNFYSGINDIESRVIIADLKSDMTHGLITWTAADDEI